MLLLLFFLLSEGIADDLFGTSVHPFLDPTSFNPQSNGFSGLRFPDLSDATGTWAFPFQTSNSQRETQFGVYPPPSNPTISFPNSNFDSVFPDYTFNFGGGATSPPSTNPRETSKKKPLLLITFKMSNVIVPC